MMSSGLVVFREVFEAALVVGIILAATTGLANRNRWIGFGILGGLIGSGVVAAFAGAIAEMASGMGQELFNACILFAAVAVLGWSVVWMRRHGREIAIKVTEIGKGVAEGGLPVHMLSIVVGLAVLREGAETVLFLFGIAAQGATAIPMFAGALIGLGAGVALGYVMYRGLIKIPTRHLFTVTSWLLVFLAAGMASQAAAYLVAADVLPPLGNGIWDTSHVLSERDLLGQFLHTLIGYDSHPSGVQLVFYAATLATIGLLMRLAARAPLSKKTVAAAAAAALALLPHTVSAGTKVYSPIVEEGEFAIEARGSNGFDTDRTKDGAQDQIYELEYGVTDRWQTAVFGQLKKAPEGNLRYNATAWENIIQLFEQGEPWIDSGLYVEYKIANDDEKADTLEGKILLEKPLGQTVNTLNLIFEKQVGSNAEEGTVFGYAYRTRYRWKPWLEPAIEAFGEIGELRAIKPTDEQDHKLGPVILGRIPLIRNVAFYYELGWLFGLTKGTADNTIKWLAELEFYF